jgi:hypothetical protein
MATTKAKATSTAVAVKKNTSIVSIQDQLKAMVAANAGRVAPPTGSSIKITQDKKFQLPDGTKTGEALDLVIVDFVFRNEYYEGAFDPNNITSPVCFAIHPNQKEMVPSSNSPDKQCEDCASCPANQFGSAGKGKACKNTVVMAVLPPEADADTPLWLLKVSPTALKGFSGYISALNRMEVAPIQMVVEVGFNPAETFASLTFSNPRPNDNVAEHFARLGEAKDMLAVEPDTTRVAAPKPVGRVAARKPVGARR